MDMRYRNASEPARAVGRMLPTAAVQEVRAESVCPLRICPQYPQKKIMPLRRRLPSCGFDFARP